VLDKKIEVGRMGRWGWGFHKKLQNKKKHFYSLYENLENVLSPSPIAPIAPEHELVVTCQMDWYGHARAADT